MTTYQQVEATARRLGFESYYHYLQSDHWMELKAAKLKGRLCIVCSTNKRLIPHHKRYRNLLDVTLDDLEPMCTPCHDVFHMACRKTGVPYLDMEVPQIVATTNAFRASEDFARREAKLARRNANRATFVSNASKTRIRRQFKHFIRGKVSKESMRDFCAWLQKEIV